MVQAGALLVVAAALIREKTVLVQQRPAGKAMAGYWEFPGGKVEPGETPIEALARELAEELGVAVSPASLMPCAFGTDRIGDRTLVLLLYTCTEWQGEPAALEAPALCWANSGELRRLVMPPADAPLVDALGMLLS
jgi:8-oxo-dGTP diphosphatase